MKDYISERVILLAEYMIEHKATVRKAAKEFNISKSTVHKDVTERLQFVNKELAKKIKVVLEKNKADRHIRGGLATKQKYENKRKRGA